MTTTYTTRNEAVEREIVAAIEANGDTADGFDIDAIAEKVLGGHDEGYAPIVDTDEFWRVVAANERGGQ